MSIQSFVNSVDWKPLGNGFHIGEYNGVTLCTTSDKQMFNASILPSQLRPTKTLKDFTNSKFYITILKYHPDWECVYAQTGKRISNGKYMKWELLERMTGSMDSIKSFEWINGSPDWREKGNEGYLYFVQTSDHKGTNIHKVGRTWNMKQRTKSYGKQVKIHRSITVDDMYAAEKVMQNAFAGRYDRAKRDGNGDGEEYYIIEDLEEALELFKEIEEQLKE